MLDFVARVLWHRGNWLVARLAIVGTISLLSSACFGQGSAPNPAEQLPPKFIPKSPTVSAFQRFDSQQLVDAKTGAAQLSIPLAEVSCGSLRLPVSLAYSYTGLQVGQPYDLVGLGWTVQAGTSITRQVNGLVDESVANDLTRRYNPDTVLQAINRPRYLQLASRNELDTGPDIYSFSLPEGNSGRFVILDTAILLLPQQALRVCRMNPQNGSGFQITTEAGIRYQFQAIEVTTPNHNNFSSVVQHASAWHLTRMISADHADTIQLHYTSFSSEKLHQQSTVTTGRYYTGTYQNNGNVVDSPPDRLCGSTADYKFHNVGSEFPSRVEAQYLNLISARGTHLILNRSSASPHELTQVRLMSTTGGIREIKQVRLYQSPFDKEFSAQPDYRLRLDSLQESAQGVTLPAYRFYYNNQPMPSRGSAAKDYWGYANGAQRNGDFRTTAVPTLLADPRLGELAANRNPNFSSAVAGALQVVHYPTGGNTHWEYEPGRIAADFEDIPLSYRYEDVATGFDPATAQYTPGTRRLLTSSSLLTFQVRQAADIEVGLHREPHDSVNTTGGTNTYRDFNIWHHLPTSDTLITKTAYRIFDGQGYERKFIFHLQPGTYKAQVYCEQYEPNSDITVRIPYRDSTLLKLGLPGPGVRVARTTTTATSAPPLVHKYQYAANGYCSGQSLLPESGKGFYQYTSKNQSASGGQGISTGLLCTYINTSSDNRGLGNEFNKYDFYYSCVVDENGNDNGSIVNYFTHLPQQFNDVVLTDQLIYQQDAHQPQNRQLAQRTSYNYFTDAAREYPLFRVRVVVSHEGDAFNPGIDSYEVDLYSVRASFIAPAGTQHFRYDEQRAVHTSFTRNTYAQQRLVQTATSTSTGWDIQRYKRLSDYAPGPAVDALRVTNFNPVIESQRWQRLAGRADSTLVGGQLTFYDARLRQPAGSWSLDLAQPAAHPNAERQTNGRYASFKSDTRYRPVDSVRYDPATGLVRERQRLLGPCTTYLWGYDRTQVVAQIDNATYAQVLAVLGQPAIDQLLGKQTGSDAQVRALLAPLRTRLPQAKVSTYTYEPLVGVNSQTGPDGRTIFYEYDALGRLLRVRDEQNRILNQQEYKYGL